MILFFFFWFFALLCFALLSFLSNLIDWDSAFILLFAFSRWVRDGNARASGQKRRASPQRERETDRESGAGSMLAKRRRRRRKRERERETYVGSGFPCHVLSISFSAERLAILNAASAPPSRIQANTTTTVVAGRRSEQSISVGGHHDMAIRLEVDECACMSKNEEKTTRCRLTENVGKETSHSMCRSNWFALILCLVWFGFLCVCVCGFDEQVWHTQSDGDFVAARCQHEISSMPCTQSIIKARQTTEFVE